ncbi:hypothetical protein BDBG_00072 [Blastomyces gilchristii SLH14081]|uniref:BZIP domain-containing protein n=1 Tax=Blastomyces gilchristii (strain SLH14081) TaxID=559298 RepID=A0A179U7P9_BLAGS|nr:uncharacterized protein BDBG_00072 [Blastomyces gilchristii SLH14081]OAT03338.1 hypothetical protein BDBG_00072 [Blastomyces gilchristii SLH14081]
MSRGSSDWVSASATGGETSLPRPVLSHSVDSVSNKTSSTKYQDTQALQRAPSSHGTQTPAAMQHGIQSANKNRNKDSNDATSADAIRIRDNQRRSRARRKEYQQDLERRVQKFEQQGVQATIEVQTAARKVARENTLLRSLLKLKGVATAEIDEYISNANGGENGAAMTLNGNGNAKTNVNGNGNGNLNQNNDRLRAGIGFAQLQPATSPNSTTASPSVPLPTPTTAVFPNTMNQNQNEGRNENQPSIQLDNYPSYYPAEQATVQPSPQYVESPSGQNIPSSASASISTSTSSMYSPTASFTSASLGPPTNNDQQCQPQPSSYQPYATPIPYAASRYPQGLHNKTTSNSSRNNNNNNHSNSPSNSTHQSLPPNRTRTAHPRPTPTPTPTNPNCNSQTLRPPIPARQTPHSTRHPAKSPRASSRACADTATRTPCVQSWVVHPAARRARWAVWRFLECWIALLGVVGDDFSFSVT